MQACKFKDGKWCPKFVVIIAQKSRHTKFFQPTSADNVPAGRMFKIVNICMVLVQRCGARGANFLFFSGTVVDNKICHPRNNDFYLCAQAGMVVSI